MILRKDDEENYLTVDETGYTIHVSGWNAGGFTYTRAALEGRKKGIGPDTWAIMQYQHMRRLSLI